MQKEQPKDHRLQIMIDKELLKQIDDYRYNERIPTRGQAVRELIMKGLEKRRSTGIYAYDEAGVAEFVDTDKGIVATVPTAVETFHFGFPETTSSGFIVQTALEASGEKWTPEEARVHTGKYEIARRKGEGSYKFKVGETVEEVEIEKKAGWEMKKMDDLLYLLEGKSTQGIIDGTDTD